MPLDAPDGAQSQMACFLVYWTDNAKLPTDAVALVNDDGRTELTPQFLAWQDTQTARVRARAAGVLTRAYFADDLEACKFARAMSRKWHLFGRYLWE